MGRSRATSFLPRARRIVGTFRRGLRLLQREGLGGLAERAAGAGFLKDASYRLWVHRYDRLSEEDRDLIRERIASFRDPPIISLILQVGGAPLADLRPSLDALGRQIYPHWEAILASDGPTGVGLEEIPQDLRSGRLRRSSRALALGEAKGDLVGLLQPSDVLPEHALYMLAEELQAHPDAELIYSDHDRLDARGRRFEPWFKSDWNPDLLLSEDCIGAMVAFRGPLLRGVGEAAIEENGAYESILRLTERAAPLRARHIPHLLCHRSQTAPPPDRSAALKAHLERRGIAARVERLSRPGYHRIRYPLPAEPPLVSLIVPTRDRTELLRRCVDGLLQRTTYRRFELLIVDNRSEEPETARYLSSIESDPRVRILVYDAPFDFAALNNWAVGRANGTLLGFLNNDTEVISRDWLEEMASQALRPEIGAVGAKLLYPDGTLQHGGILLGIGGVAGHAHQGLPRSSGGYHGRAALVQNVSAVTAACMVLRRAVFEEIGGFDEARFAVAFNDVDLCLRLGERGYRILWTPFAEFYHHESASLGLPEEPGRRELFAREAAVLVERWREKIESDPAYNPNLTLRRGDFALAFPPRAEKPWLARSVDSTTGAKRRKVM